MMSRDCLTDYSLSSHYIPFEVFSFSTVTKKKLDFALTHVFAPFSARSGAVERGPVTGNRWVFHPLYVLLVSAVVL